jgi:hypothetical protein
MQNLCFWQNIGLAPTLSPATRHGCVDEFDYVSYGHNGFSVFLALEPMLSE